MTELVLGLAWPVALVAVAVLAFVAFLTTWEKRGEGAALREVARLDSMLANLAHLHDEVRTRTKALEDAQQRHASMLGRQQKGGQL